VFASPRRLHLWLLCTNDRPVEKMLYIWPALPIVLVHQRRNLWKQGVNNIIHALKHYDRVYRIDLSVINPLLKKMAAMKGPFPALTYLELLSGRKIQVLPDSFLGGSAPHLRSVKFYGIAYPGLPKLLSSTHDIVHLHLRDIPYSGYISPEAMATCLTALTQIENFSLHFRSPRYDRATQGRSQLRHTPFVLPALREFSFTGDSDYLERIITPINAPALMRIYIKFFNQLVFKTPSLRQFIGRTEASKAFWGVVVSFRKGSARLTLVGGDYYPSFDLGISSRMLDWQLSSVAQLCKSSLPPLPALECLKLFQDRRHSQDDIEDIQWLEILHPFTQFTSVKDLVLSGPLVQHVARTVQKMSGERLIEVLPGLQGSWRTGRRQPEEHIQEPFSSWSLPDGSLVFP